MKTVAICITANGTYKLISEQGMYRVESKEGLAPLVKRDGGKERALEAFSNIPSYKGY